MKVLIYIMGSIVLLYLLFINIAPGVIENSRNKVYTSPPYQAGEQAEQLHESFQFVADLHCDALLWDRDLLDESTRGHVDIPRLQQANVALQVFTIVSKSPKNQNYDSNSGDTDNITLLQVAQGNAIGTWFSLADRAMRQASHLNRMADESEGNFRVIRSRQDLIRFIRERETDQDLVAGILGVEGAHMLEENMENLDRAFDAGIRIIGPVHFFDNALGGSAHGVDKHGITEFGRDVLRRAEEKEMLIDLSHASPALIEDILDIASRPVLVTHTGVKGTCDNPRNLSDAQLRRIADNGGLVGIGLFTQAVCGQDATATAQAIRYAADLIGVAHVALGSDFDGSVTTPFDVTGLPLITEALMKEGFSESEIAKIMGGNVRDFFLRNLPGE